METAEHKDIFSYFKYVIKPGLLGFFIFFLLGFTLLHSLGTWQLNRLDWKNTLIQEINDSFVKPVTLLDNLLHETLSQNKRPDYRRVSFEGRLESDKTFKLLMKKHKETLGYYLILPVTVNNGARILVNMGWLPNTVDPTSLTFSSKPITFIGISKTTSGKTPYTPANNYETNELFYLDPQELAHEKAWPSLLPFFVTLIQPLQGEGIYPLPIKFELDIRNSHLEYALTWYLLALFWLLTFVFYARRKIQNKD